MESALQDGGPPQCFALLICEYVQKDDGGVPRTIVGTFNHVVGPVDGLLPPFFVYAGVTNIEGPAEVTLDIRHEDGRPAAEYRERFDFPNRQYAQTATYLIEDLELFGAGRYVFRLLVDGREVSARSFYAVDSEDPEEV